MIMCAIKPVPDEGREPPPLPFDAREQARCRLAACRAMIDERNRVGKAFGFALCAAPVWDMLLDLYSSECEGQSPYVWALCLAANVPMSTAHRKVQDMAAAGLIERKLDKTDQRRMIVTLSDDCAVALDTLMDLRCDSDDCSITPYRG